MPIFPKLGFFVPQDPPHWGGGGGGSQDPETLSEKQHPNLGNK